MAKRRRAKGFELNFGTLLILVAIICIIIFAIKKIPSKKTKVEDNTENKDEVSNVEEKVSKIYANDVIILDIGNLSDKWKVVEKQNGGIKFYIQGPSKENEDGTTDDIRINVYIEKSDMTNEEFKNQMLEHSIYSTIEYTKTQLINDVQWRQFEAENKGVKAKILAIMQDGYMYAVEIVGEENLYNEFYNEAMKTAMTTKIAERIPEDVVSKTIYNYDNLANIKLGGTRLLLNSLNLKATEEQQIDELPQEYSDYENTGIKYSDFEKAMTKFMTKEVLAKEFSEFVEYQGILLMKETKGKQADYMIQETNIKSIKGTETTYEIVKQNMNNYITLRQNITLKYENGTCVVSNIEA